MSLLEAIFFGVVQGLTEFLPVSSSGHLVLFGSLLNPESSNVSFFVLLHFATLLAVIIYFFSDLKKISFSDLKTIVFATIPVVIVGVLFNSQIEEAFSNSFFVGICLMITGLLLYSADLHVRKTALGKAKDFVVELGKKESLTPPLKKAMVIGLMQAVAIFPGISRSGSTVATGLLLGISKEKAFRFSFLLSIPAILGASILELVDQLQQFGEFSISLNDGAGMMAAFIAGLMSMKLFSLVLKRMQLRWFGVYVITVGLFAILFL